MKRVKLGEICQIVSGSTPKTSIDEYWDGDLDWITPAELTDDSYIVTESARKITELGVKKTGLKPFPRGTVILSSRAPIGKVAIAGKEMFCNQGFKNLICSEVILPEYLYWFLKGNTEHLNSLGRGATFKEISKKIVSDIEINVPDIGTQKNAVDILGRCWAIIKKRKEESEKFDELIKARFVEMFGDQFEAQKIKVGDIADVYIGLTYKPDNVSEIGTIVLRSGNIQNQSLQIERGVVRVSGVKIAEDKYVRDKDILMCARNGSAKLVGKSCLIRHPEEEMAFGAFMSVIRTEYPYFLQGFFSSDYFKNQLTNVGTTSVNQITSKMLKNYSVIKPMKNQEKDFSVFCAQVDKSKVAIQKSLDETKLLFDSLMQKYFG